MAYIPQGELEQIVKLVGYSGLFVAVFAETGIFFMFFLPGSSMLFTAAHNARGNFGRQCWILVRHEGRSRPF